MTLDELAAAVVGVEPDDTSELAAIRDALLELIGRDDLIEEAKSLAGDAVSLITEIIENDVDDPSETLQAIGQIVSSLQLLSDKPIDINPIHSPSKEKEKEPCEVEPVKNEEEKSLPDDIEPTESLEKGKDSVEKIPETQEYEDDCLSNDPELIQEFVTESLDHLQISENALLQIETDPDDENALSSIFRAFHTIKGTAGFLNLDSIQTLAHRAENLLDRARNQEIKLVGAYADLALESADVLKNMINDLVSGSGGEAPENLDDLIARLENPEERGMTTETETDEPRLRLGDILVAQDKLDRKTVETAATNQGGDKIGESLIASGKVQASDIAQALRMQQKTSESKTTDATVRVSTKLLDNLINMVGELVIVQSMIAQNDWISSQKDIKLSKNCMQMSKITRDLQNLSMSFRMVPLKSTFQKMARLVRDLARKSGKTVNFITEGEDTEIDRNMVELLSDPLIHMVRNAVDHGIESVEERIKAGKTEQGKVILRAYHSSGNVVIEIQDDGKGLNRDKIIEKAINKGIIKNGDELTDSEVFKLVFHAGLSTAEKVTDVSGRGVGMDVVRKNIEAIKGTVDVSSNPGEGSTFALRIPLTLAIIDGMLIQVGSEKYIIPTLNVIQAFQPEQSAISSVTGRGEQVMVRGDLLPIFRLHKTFNVSGAKKNPTEALLLVVEHEGESCALLADDLLGQQQVVIKSLCDSVKNNADGVSGAAIMSDGRIGLILDVAGVMRLARKCAS